MKRILQVFLAMAGVWFCAVPALATPNVNYYITTTTNSTATGGSWQVYADVSHDNDGLANYEIAINSTGSVQVTSTIKLMAPRPVDPSNQYQDGSGFIMGFQSGFNSIGTLSGGSRTGIIGAQTTVYSGTDDPTWDMGIFVGVGQEPSSASPQNGTQGPIDGSGSPTGIAMPVWGYLPFGVRPAGNGLQHAIAGTLIEQGTYSQGSGPGSLSVLQDPSGFSEVLGTGESIPPGGISFPGTYASGSNVLWGYDPYELGDTPIATTSGDTIIIPEPASLGLLMAVGLGLALAGRRLRPGRKFADFKN